MRTYECEWCAHADQYIVRYQTINPWVLQAWRFRQLLQISSSHFDFGHVVVVKELVFPIIPGNPHARPIASCDCALISRAVVPGDALPNL